jgi:undecaprenyl pyrophosphate phosphatase UppP
VGSLHRGDPVGRDPGGGGDLLSGILEALIGLPHSAEARRFALGLILALLPSVAAGLALKKLMDEVLLNPATAMPFIAGCWIVGGIIILVFERIAPKPRWLDGRQAAFVQGFQIGCCQILSIIPSCRASGATILGRRTAGCGPQARRRFSLFICRCPPCWAPHLDCITRLDSTAEPEHRRRLCGVLCVAFS